MKVLMSGMGTLVLGALGAEKPFDLNRINELLSDPKLNIQTGDELLAHFPDEMKSQYVLMETSGSNHFASKERPRVILFDKKANLLVAFSGDPTKKGYGFMEAIQYDLQKGKYDFRRIDFPKDAGQVGAPKMSAPNPSNCMTCHTSNLKPNWEPYPFWPGAIGSSFRTFKGDETEKYMEAFIQSGAKLPRYRKLDRKGNLEATRGDGLPETMSSRLHNALSRQQQQNIVDAIQAGPNYKAFKFAIVGALSGCPNFSKMIPENVQKALAHDLDYYRKSTDQSFAKVAPENTRLLYRTREAWANLRWLTEGRGQSMAGWAHSVQSPYLFGAVGNVEVRGLVEGLVLDWDFRNLSVPYSAIGNQFIMPATYDRLQKADDEPKLQKFCPELEKMSLAALKKFDPRDLQPKASAPKGSGRSH